MTRDDIIRMAQEAGWSEIGADLWGATNDGAMSIYALERFAALVAATERERAIGIAKGMQEELQAKFEQTYMEGVIAGAAAEREACAKVCDAVAKKMAYLWLPLPGHGESAGVTDCAVAIRARGNK